MAESVGLFDDLVFDDVTGPVCGCYYCIKWTAVPYDAVGGSNSLWHSKALVTD